MGSGKTTLLRRILTGGHGLRMYAGSTGHLRFPSARCFSPPFPFSAVVVNDMAELNIDGMVASRLVQNKEE